MLRPVFSIEGDVEKDCFGAFRSTWSTLKGNSGDSGDGEELDLEEFFSYSYLQKQKTKKIWLDPHSAQLISHKRGAT